MGTETTSATYRRTQNPLIAKFFYGITGIQRKCQRTLGTKIANGVSITGARIWLTRAINDVILTKKRGEDTHESEIIFKMLYVHVLRTYTVINMQGKCIRL